jgi:putative transposase
MGKQERKWQDVGEVLAYFGSRKRKALAGYEEYVVEGIKAGKRADLTGGGLVRSLGGWAQVISARRKGERMASDARILGKGEFIEEVFSEAEEKIKETLKWRKEVPSLKILLGQVAKEEQVEPEEIRRGSRRRPVAKARRRLCQVAKKLGYSGAAVARRLGVTTSLVNYYASSLEKGH